MKTKILVLMGLVSFAGIAFADIPPAPGSKIQAQITDVVAARIVYDSLNENEQALPGEYTFKTNCGEVKTGKLHMSKSASGDQQKVVCSAYYCYGHKAVCSLEETYK
jgi:hypothetical protein